MIDSILRHEATLDYKGNLDHDTWRTSREAELILVPLNGEQLSLRALMSQYHIRLAITGPSREQAVAAILWYECPETLRQACFQIFWRDHQRLPTSGCQCRAENAYAAYLACSLHRRYATYRGKAALTDDEIRSWDLIFLQCGGTPPPWQDDPELQAIATSGRKTVASRSYTLQGTNSSLMKINLPACSALFHVLVMAMCISTIVMARLPSSDLVYQPQRFFAGRMC